MISERYIRFARLALDAAKESDSMTIMDHSLCAFIVKKNRILSIGYNSRKTTPGMLGSRMSMVHAEFDAIKRCAYPDRAGSDLIVVRMRKDGLTGMARPCIICQRHIRDARIRNVYYTISGSNPKNPILEKFEDV